MRKPAKMHSGDTLPPATEFEEGDLFFLRPTGKLYLRSGGAWNLAAGGLGQPGGVATLDSSGKVVERLSYEGSANGVATLDSAGKLAQGVHGRIVETRYAYGNSSDNPISTTAAVGQYIMPSPRITVTLESTYTAIVIATLSAYSDADHPYTIWTLLTRSLDGGSTWNAFGTYLGAGSPGTSGYRTPITQVGRYAPGVYQSVTFGISVGNAAGLSNTINVHAAQYTSLYVIVIDEG